MMKKGADQSRGGSTTGMLTHVKSLHKDVYLAAAGEQGIAMNVEAPARLEVRGRGERWRQ